jgi:hypothetical protein
MHDDEQEDSGREKQKNPIRWWTGIKRIMACVLFAAGNLQWLFPKWKGIFREPANFSEGEALIVGAIFVVGGLILFFMPNDPELG